MPCAGGTPPPAPVGVSGWQTQETVWSPTAHSVPDAAHPACRGRGGCSPSVPGPPPSARPGGPASRGLSRCQRRAGRRGGVWWKWGDARPAWSVSSWPAAVRASQPVPPLLPPLPCGPSLSLHTRPERQWTGRDRWTQGRLPVRRGLGAGVAWPPLPRPSSLPLPRFAGDSAGLCLWRLQGQAQTMAAVFVGVFGSKAPCASWGRGHSPSSQSQPHWPQGSDKSLGPRPVGPRLVGPRPGVPGWGSQAGGSQASGSQAGGSQGRGGQGGRHHLRERSPSDLRTSR